MTLITNGRSRKSVIRSLLKNGANMVEELARLLNPSGSVKDTS
jgi:hypothetical protein